jgi:hypothetical protein
MGKTFRRDNDRNKRFENFRRSKKIKHKNPNHRFSNNVQSGDDVSDATSYPPSGDFYQ